MFALNKWLFYLNVKMFLDVIEHPNQDIYPDQKIAIVNINDYAYLVPFLQYGEEIFLKTIIPSRKATSKYVRDRK